MDSVSKPARGWLWTFLWVIVFLVQCANTALIPQISPLRYTINFPHEKVTSVRPSLTTFCVI
eukprot:6754762-Pyramimonas_sp.AAC.1